MLKCAPMKKQFWPCRSVLKIANMRSRFVSLRDVMLESLVVVDQVYSEWSWVFAEASGAGVRDGIVRKTVEVQDDDDSDRFFKKEAAKVELLN